MKRAEKHSDKYNQKRRKQEALKDRKKANERFDAHVAQSGKTGGGRGIKRKAEECTSHPVQTEAKKTPSHQRQASKPRKHCGGKARGKKCKEEDATPTMTRRVRLYPTPQQRETLLQWIGTTRWTYNQCVKTYQEFPGAHMTLTKLRRLHVNNANFKPGGTHEQHCWALQVPYEVRDGGMADFVTALGVQIGMVKDGTKEFFEMKPRNRRRNKQSVLIRSKQWNQRGSKERKFLETVRRKELIPSKVESDMRLVCNYKRYFYLHLSTPLKPVSEQEPPNRVLRRQHKAQRLQQSQKVSKAEPPVKKRRTNTGTAARTIATASLSPKPQP